MEETQWISWEKYAFSYCS